MIKKLATIRRYRKYILVINILTQLRRHLVHPATLRNAIRRGCVFLWQDVTRLEGDFWGAKTRRASKAQSNSAQSPSRHFKIRKFKHLRLFLFLHFAPNPVSARLAGLRCRAKPLFKPLAAECSTTRKSPKLAFCW